MSNEMNRNEMKTKQTLRNVQFQFYKLLFIYIYTQLEYTFFILFTKKQQHEFPNGSNGSRVGEL